MIAHVAGLPLEELAMSAAGGGTGLLALGWLRLRLTHRRSPRP